MPPASTGGFLSIPVSHGLLEAVLRQPQETARGAAVMCHPHPLHGGTMHTKAVYRAAQAMTEAGLAALRFNFRGVGRSTGSFDGGIGEAEDARSALEHVERLFPGLPLVAGGFSFGSLAALRAGAGHGRVAAMVGVGLAFDRYDYGFLADARCPVLIVQGECDEFGSGARAMEFARQLAGPVEAVVIPGADHYFHGHFDELRRGIREFLTRPAVARALEQKRVETR